LKAALLVEHDILSVLRTRERKVEKRMEEGMGG